MTEDFKIINYPIETKIHHILSTSFIIVNHGEPKNNGGLND